MDSGDSWTALSGNLENIVITLGINRNGDIFAATSDGLTGKLFRSSDKGQTWARLTLPWSMVIWEIAFDSRGLIFFVNLGGEEAHATIWRSSNNGEHWTNIPVPSLYPVDVEISSNGYLYVATAQGVFRSANGGNTWLSVSPGLTSKVVHKVTSDNSGTIYASTLHGVFRSSNNGLSWHETSLSKPCMDILLAIQDVGLFAGNGRLDCLDPNEIYFSKDKGRSWTQLNNGLPDEVVTRSAISTTDHVFLGTRSHDVFRTSLHK